MVWKELQFHNLKLWDTNEILSYLCCHLILHHHHHQNEVAFISIRKKKPFTPQIFPTLFHFFPKLPEEFTNHIPTIHPHPSVITHSLLVTMEKPGFRSGAKNLVDERPKARRFNLVKTWQLDHCYPGGAGSLSPVGGEKTPRIFGV